MTESDPATRRDDAAANAEPAYKALTRHLPEPRFVPLPDYVRRDEAHMLAQAESFYRTMARRRTTRHFATDPVPRRLIELAILTAGTAPSGAHRQPWRFVAIDDPALKARVRAAAEAEELKTYSERMTDEWREALHPLGTDHVKEHLTDAPWLVVLFAEKYGLRADGSHRKNYYVDESVGIAAGLFVAAIHLMGLVTLTHTPNPMGFLREVLGRGTNEKAVLVMPVGYPRPDAQVPDLQRLPLEAIVQWNAGGGGA